MLQRDIRASIVKALIVGPANSMAAPVPAAVPTRNDLYETRCRGRRSGEPHLFPR